MDQREIPQYSAEELARLEEIKANHRQKLQELYPDVIVPEPVLEYIAGVQLKDEKEKHQLEELARIDPLTGLYNRRMFDEEMEQAAAVVRRTGEPTCLLAIDIDEFSEINASHGHEGGDKALKQIAAVLEGRIRPTDRIFRAGEHGDEFFMILPRTDISGSVLLGEWVREAVEHLDIVFNNNPIKITVSLGTSLFDPLSSPEETVKKADVALYAAKRAGKNQIKVFDDGSIKTPIMTPDPDHPGQTFVTLEPAPAVFLT